MIIPLISNYKEPGLTVDLNLVRGDPPASVKFVGNQNHLSSCRSIYTETWNYRLS